jgi:ABC-2 type transport system permease protein
MGMIKYLVIFAVGLVVGLHFGNDLLGIVVVMASFALCMTALAFAISTLVKTEMQANSVQLLLAMTLAPLGGAWWPLDIVPEFMRTVGHVSPVAWAMDAFNKLLFAQGTLGDVLVPVGVLLALSAASSPSPFGGSGTTS